MCLDILGDKMKFETDKKDLLNALKELKGLTDKKSLMDILKNVNISASGSYLTLIATDLTDYLKLRIDAEIIKCGGITVNCKDLFNSISKLSRKIPSNIITFNLDKTKDEPTLTFQFKDDNVITSLDTLPIGDYPKVPDVKFDKVVSLPAEILTKAIEKTEFVTSKDMKFNLSGVLFSFESDKFEIGATDGHQLAVTSHNQGNECYGDRVEFIVPVDTLPRLKQSFKTGDIVVAINGVHVQFEQENKVLVTRPIDQKFPNYHAVIPESTPYFCTLHKQELIDTIDKMTATNIKSRNSSMMFTFTNHVIHLERSVPDKASSKATLNPMKANMENDSHCIEMGLNYDFLKKMLPHIEGNKVVCDLTDKESPIRIKETTKDGIEFIYVIMPLNI